MSPEHDLSVEAIAERMEGLSALHRLGTSLLEARMQPIRPEVFRRRSLPVEGILDARSLALAGAGLPRTERFGEEVTVFTSFVDTVHHVGREFELVMPDFHPDQAQGTRCILVGVTQQFSKPWDEVPSGSKAICRLRFVGGLPQLIATLPTLDGWAYKPAIWLATRDDLRRLRGDAPALESEPVRKA